MLVPAPIAEPFGVETIRVRPQARVVSGAVEVGYYPVAETEAMPAPGERLLHPARLCREERVVPPDLMHELPELATDGVALEFPQRTQRGPLRIVAMTASTASPRAPQQARRPGSPKSRPSRSVRTAPTSTPSWPRCSPSPGKLAGTSETCKLHLAGRSGCGLVRHRGDRAVGTSDGEPVHQLLQPSVTHRAGPTGGTRSLNSHCCGDNVVGPGCRAWE